MNVLMAVRLGTRRMKMRGSRFAVLSLESSPNFHSAKAEGVRSGYKLRIAGISGEE